MFLRYFLFLAALCQAAQSTVTRPAFSQTPLQTPDRMHNPLEYSNLVQMEPLERIELAKKYLALGQLREAGRPPISASLDDSTYYYESSNSYISLSGNNCDADNYQVQLASSGNPMSVCNGGIMCTCKNTGTGKDYVMSCDMWDNLDCSGAPTFSNEYTVSPTCSESISWYATYGLECTVSSSPQGWNIYPSTAFVYLYEEPTTTCSSPVSNFGSTFDNVCLTQEFCFSGAKSCIQSCSGSSLSVASFQTADCTGDSTKQDMSGYLGCTCPEDMNICQNWVCSTATTTSDAAPFTNTTLSKN